MKRLLLALCTVITLASLARAEPALTVRAVELKAMPKADAKTVASVAADAAVDVVKREGAWVQLTSGKSTGWAKLFDIRTAASAGAPARKSASGAGIGDTLGLAMGTRGSSVTTGVRGLDADMLARATPNAQEFATLVTYARSKDQAAAFAKAGHLATREVALLDANGKPASGAAK